MKKVSLYPADIYLVIDKSLCGELDLLVLYILYLPLLMYLLKSQIDILL